MLVAWVYAMLGEVRGVRVVNEVVEWCDDRLVEDGLAGNVAGCVGGRVDTDGYESCKESGYREKDEGKWSVKVSDST